MYTSILITSLTSALSLILGITVSSEDHFHDPKVINTCRKNLGMSGWHKVSHCPVEYDIRRNDGHTFSDLVSSSTFLMTLLSRLGNISQDLHSLHYVCGVQV